MKLHPGIRIDKIPVRSAAGLIFVITVLAIFLIGVPATRWFLILGIAGGIVTAAILHFWHNR